MSLGFTHAKRAFPVVTGMLWKAMFPSSAARTSIATWITSWVGLLAAAACHRPAPTARERVLAGLPAGAIAVAVADGRALSHPRVRGVLDVASARWPVS